MGFGRSPHCEEEKDQDKGYHGGQLRQVQQAEAGGRKHRSLAVSNSSNSLAISHLNGSLAKLAVSNSSISRMRHGQPKCLSALHLTSSSLDRKKDLVVVGPQAKQVLGNQGPHSPAGPQQ